MNYEEIAETMADKLIAQGFYQRPYYAEVSHLEQARYMLSSIVVYKGYTIKDLIERGLIVADDQSLPEIMCKSIQMDSVNKAWDLAQQEMLEANFRKIEKETEEGKK